MRIVISGIPIAKKRHRCACRGGQPVSYDVQTNNETALVRAQIMNEWQARYNSENKVIAMEASNLARVEAFDVTCTFLFPPNKSDSQRVRNAKLWGFEVHNGKPDCDNLEKFYLDCATGIIWSNDCQVVSLRSKKIYSENPRTEIEIMAHKKFKLNSNAEQVMLVFSPQKLMEFLRDVEKFSMWSSELGEALVSSAETLDKKPVLESASSVLIDFAVKYAADLTKIKKFSESTTFNKDETCKMDTIN